MIVKKKEKEKLVIDLTGPQGNALQEIKMNDEQFLKVTTEQVSQVYSGKKKGCRCECIKTDGDHAITAVPAIIAVLLKKAQKLVAGGGYNYEGDHSYFEVETGKHTRLTFFFEEVRG